MNIKDRWALVAIMSAFLDQCREFQSGAGEWTPFWSGRPARFVAAGRIIELRVVGDEEAGAKFADDVATWLERACTLTEEVRGVTGDQAS